MNHPRTFLTNPFFNIRRRAKGTTVCNIYYNRMEFIFPPSVYPSSGNTLIHWEREGSSVVMKRGKEGLEFMNEVDYDENDWPRIAVTSIWTED